MTQPLLFAAYRPLLVALLCLLMGTARPGMAARHPTAHRSQPPCTVLAVTQPVTVALNSSGTASVTAAQVNNGSTASCGFAASGGLSVSPSAFTCANIGSNTVTLTVTDVNGNTNSATATVTVQDVSAPNGYTVGPLPVAPALATSNVPEASNYGILYQLDVPTTAAFNALASVPYTVNNSGMTLPGGNPTRVAYYMELTNNSTGAVSWAWASMDNFASSLPQLGIPHPSANNVAWHQSVTNLTVAASAGAGLSTGSAKTGRVEMWYRNYGTTNSDGVPGASSSTFDFGDQISNNGSYGSFQVHNLTNSQNVLAYNNWGGNGGTGDIGISNQATSHPDWTFANNAASYSVKRIYVLVPNGGGFTQSATLNLNASGQATLGTAAVYTGATDNCTASPAVTLSKTLFTCAELGTNLVNVTVADASGNATTQVATVTVQDLLVPTPSTRSVTVSLDAAGSATVTAAQVDNGSTDNCGVATLSVSPSSFTCANIGPNTVTLTVTDASGNAATATATVTVQDVTAPMAGALPAAPATAVANVPEAGAYGVLYQLDMPTAAAFNNLASVPYTINNSGMSLPAPTRVAYYMELTNSSTGAVSWAWASMDNFASSLTQLGIPHPSANNVAWHQSVTNLTVAASAGAGLSTGSAKTGRVEMWPSNYGATNADGVPGASSSTFDFGDQNSGGSGYGSFQVHNLTDGQTVLAYNRWGTSNATADLGIGSQGTGNPDWTFANNAAAYSVKRIYVLVPNAGASGSFVQNATVQLSASGTVALAQSQVYIGATDNCGIASVTVTPNSFNCANVGPNTVTVTVTDNSGNASSQTATVTVQDNRAPVGAGAGSLPVAPVLATSNVPEASNYGILYQLDVPTTAAFNTLASVPYTVNNSGTTLPGGNPTRVAYYMELTNSSTGAVSWAWASMDNFASSLPQLGIPHPSANNVAWHQSVTNLTVAASAGAGLSTGSAKTGRVEMWPSNYGATNADGVPGASSSTFDFGDQNSGGSGYGSFQVHNLTNSQNVLAYNNWGGNGGTGDIGIGNQATSHPDWTFAGNAATYSVKRIYVLVPNGGGFTQSATLSIPVGGTATLAQNQVYTGATDNCTVTSVVVAPTTFTCANAGVNTVTVTVTDNSGNVATQSAFVTVSAPVVPAVTWLGNSTDWNDCANWSYGRVPNATTAAIIPTGLATYPNLNTGTFTALDLTVATGAGLTLGSVATLQVYGNLTNNGTASFGGTVAFVGPATNPLLGGTAATAFSTLTVNKPVGTLTLQRDISVSTALTLTTGLVNTTASYRVLLGSTATFSGETETSYLTGNLEATRTLSPAGTSSNFGGMGLTLATSAANPTVPGSTRVIRTTGTVLTGVGSSVSVKRYFDIQPTTDTGLNLTMTFNYLDVERNGIAETNLLLFRSISGPAGPFQPASFTSRNATTNVVTRTGIAALSLWTLGSSANPLPVELTAFTAEAAGADAVRLAWATASEKNADRFEVERSATADGVGFGRIATVAAHGTATTRNQYSLLDAQLPAGAALLYYRLRQVDADGTASYSPVQAVAVSGKPAPLTLAPNPAHTAATLTGAAPGARVEVLDAVGRVVMSTTANGSGSATITLPTGLAAGLYVVRAGARVHRLVVE